MPKKLVPVDLEALDAYLLSDHFPENGMGLSDIDGFLTGVAVGPAQILPSEWLPKIWGGDEPKFVSKAESQSVIGAIMGRYEEIIADLESGSDNSHFLFLESEAGHVIVADWAAGFLDAMKLRMPAWEPLVQYSLFAELLLPLTILGAGDDENHGLSHKQIDRIYRDGTVLIPKCVAGIYEFWRERRSAPKRRVKAGVSKAAAQPTAGTGSKHFIRVSLKARLYRDIEIESSASLQTLAEAIVSAYAFDLDHAYGFFSKLTGNIYDSSVRYELFADVDSDGTARGVKRTRVRQAFTSIGSKMLFLYDYGDEWRFKVEVIAIGKTASEERFPKIIASVGKAPNQYTDPDDDS